MIRTALARSRPSRFLPVCRHISTSQKTSSAHGTLPDSQSPISPELRFFNSVTGGKGLIPTYRVLDGVGQPIDGAQVPDARLYLFHMIYSDRNADRRAIRPKAIRTYAAPANRGQYIV